jgi:hypothetical protein
MSSKSIIGTRSLDARVGHRLATVETGTSCRSSCRSTLRRADFRAFLHATPRFGTKRPAAALTGPKTEYVGKWLSLVERPVRDREAAGSNPAFPIILRRVQPLPLSSGESSAPVFTKPVSSRMPQPFIHDVFGTAPAMMNRWPMGWFSIFLVRSFQRLTLTPRHETLAVRRSGSQRSRATPPRNGFT